MHPVGRLGEVDDVVDAVPIWRNAGFVTGEIPHVDGGQIAAEALKSEKLRYQQRTGAYTGDPNRALSRFVSSIESIAMAETAEWHRSFVKSGQGSDILEVAPAPEE